MNHFNLFNLFNLLKEYRDKKEYIHSYLLNNSYENFEFKKVVNNVSEKLNNVSSQLKNFKDNSDNYRPGAVEFLGVLGFMFWLLLNIFMYLMSIIFTYNNWGNLSAISKFWCLVGILIGFPALPMYLILKSKSN